MLVGSCMPTVTPPKVVVIVCCHPGCRYLATAMSEREALASLNEHWQRVRDTGEHGQP